MILVAGGAGFIGSHTCVELLCRGYDVLIADNFSNSSRDVISRISEAANKRVSFADIDLTDANKTQELFKRYKIDAVILLAGYKAVGESVEKPLMYYRNNLDIALTLLEQMQISGCRKLIFSSSATVYDQSCPSPLREDMPTSQLNPYGRTKRMIEQILEDTAASGDWSIVSLRYFNPVGAHKSGLIGEEPNGIPNNLMPYIAKVASGELECLSVFGNDYPTHDGTGVRDYIHVCDLALGHVKALEYADSHSGIEYINLGTGNGISVLEMVSAFEKACGKKIPYKIMPRRAGDCAVCFADNSKAKELLGFEPVLDVNDMCEDLWRFQTMKKDF